MRDLAALRTALTAAERAAADLLWSDDFAMVNGAYAAAERVVATCRRELAEAELAEAATDPAYQRHCARAAAVPA